MTSAPLGFTQRPGAFIETLAFRQCLLDPRISRFLLKLRVLSGTSELLEFATQTFSQSSLRSLKATGRVRTSLFMTLTNLKRKHFDRGKQMEIRFSFSRVSSCVQNPSRSVSLS